MKIPKLILDKIKNLKYSKNNVGKSEDIVLIYEEKYVLKISKNIKRLENEYNKNKWLYKYLKCPKPILFVVENNKAYFLKKYLKGKSLIEKEFTSNPDKLINLICEAFKLLRKLDKLNCPFKSNDNKGKYFVHGDFCLPNILVKNNHIAGFIDLENSGLGDVWYDYTWVLWSLMKNLKTNKYNDLLLKKLNIKFNKKKYDQYIPEDLKEEFNKLISK